MTRRNRKYTLRDHIIPLIGILLLIGFGCLAKTLMTPIDSATDTQVWDVAVAHGYSPYYLTDEYKEEYPTRGFVQTIAFVKDDLRFEFFVFDSVQSALSANRSIATEVNSIERANYGNCVGTDESRANFYVRTLRADGKYYYLMRIDNTVFYAYGNEEYADEIKSIAKELGYVGD